MQYDLLAKRKKANKKAGGRKKAPQFNNVVVFLHAENSENVAATREGHTHTAYIFMTLPVSASSSSHSRSTGNNKKKAKGSKNNNKHQKQRHSIPHFYFWLSKVT